MEALAGLALPRVILNRFVTLDASGAAAREALVLAQAERDLASISAWWTTPTNSLGFTYAPAEPHP